MDFSMEQIADCLTSFWTLSRMGSYICIQVNRNNTFYRQWTIVIPVHLNIHMYNTTLDNVQKLVRGLCIFNFNEKKTWEMLIRAKTWGTLV